MTDDKPKAKMTRAEAIECILKHIPAAHNAAAIIDFYIEAGMLEVVEGSDDIDIKVINAVAKSGYSGTAVLMELKRAGLKIVFDT